MRKFTDEQLVAYADGELATGEAQAIAAAAATDPELARRIERFAGTRRVLQEAFADKLDEPVPARLLETLGAATPSKVVPLRRAPRFASWMPTALAASIALAVGLSLSLWLPQRGAVVSVAGLPPDAAALAQALEHGASGEPQTLALAGRSYEVMPTSTLRTAKGWCREFESSLEQPERARAHGVACRSQNGQWQVIAAAANGNAAPDAGAYAPAGASGPDLTATLDVTARLTPAQEADVIRDNWHTAPH